MTTSSDTKPSVVQFGTVINVPELATKFRAEFEKHHGLISEVCEVRVNGVVVPDWRPE